ncbi:MAG: phospholipase D-like domain-containing protein [Actinomycetota bacterium]|nr:phospholipase D-like domain-containing protein [Actinomycetota bacterium]
MSVYVGTAAQSPSGPSHECGVEQLRRGEFGRGRHGSVPATYDLSGVPVKVVFAPDHTPELELVKQILNARKEIVFAIFAFAGSSGIDDALLAMADNPQIPSIRGVLDPAQAAHGWAAPRWLDHPKIELFVPEKAGVFASLRKVHHKLMVIDRRVVVAGSMNYTRPANDFRRREPVRDRLYPRRGRGHRGGCSAQPRSRSARPRRDRTHHRPQPTLPPIRLTTRGQIRVQATAVVRA